MSYRLLQRMIFSDLVVTMFMALIGASGLLMIVGAMIEASRNGLDPLGVVMVMPYLIAPTLPYTLPACLLFACTIVFGSMASTNEITAVKAGGINVVNVLWPAFALAIAATAAGIYLSDEFIPSCNRRLRELVISDLRSTMFSLLKQRGCINEPNFSYELYVKSVQDDRLHNVTIKHRNSAGQYDMVARAAEATLYVDYEDEEGTEPRVIIRLFDGVATTNTQNTVHFKDRTQQMPVPESFKKIDERNETMNFEGLEANSNRLANKAEALDVSLEVNMMNAALNGDWKSAVYEIETNREQATRHRRKSIETKAEIHVRIAQSLAPIPFVLLGCPVSILFQRRDFLQTFFMCFVPIITLYYPAMLLVFNIFKEAKEMNFFVLWAPSIAMCVFAVPFIRRVIRY